MLLFRKELCRGVKNLKTTVMTVIAIASMLLLSGCAFLSVGDMYSLPQPSEEYLQLQELIDLELSGGSEFAAPTSGSYRQSVQLYDLDGDGSSEAIAFLRGADQSPKICIYRITGGDYALALTISGDGTAVGNVEYADLNGDGGTELIVAWQMGSGFRMLNVYSLSGWESSVLLTADCTEFRAIDLNGDGITEIASLRHDGPESGSVDLHRLGADNEMHTLTAPLSEGITSVDRLRAGYLTASVYGLFVEGSMESGELLTDIFTYDGEDFKNIALDGSGVSVARRAYPMYSSDIDGDGCLEVPSARILHSQSESSSTFWAFDWYSFGATGERQYKLSTYHSSDGWYLILPDSVKDSLTVRRESSASGERMVVLSVYDQPGGEVRDFLVIYTLTGENRHDRAQLDGRFLLLESDSTAYAAKLLFSDLSREDIMSRFRLAYTEWFTGAL